MQDADFYALKVSRIFYDSNFIWHKLIQFNYKSNEKRKNRRFLFNSEFANLKEKLIYCACKEFQRSLVITINLHVN